MKAVKRIKKGSGNFDLLNDLLAWPILFKQHRAELDGCDFDFSLIDKAEQLHVELQNALANITVNPEKFNEAKAIRIKAWTCLNEPLEAIYLTGRYVFRNDPERKEMYYRDYNQRIGKLSGKSKEDQLNMPD